MRKDGAVVVPAVETVQDAVQKDMQSVSMGQTDAFSPKQLADYKKRKLIKDRLPL